MIKLSSARNLERTMYVGDDEISTGTLLFSRTLRKDRDHLRLPALAVESSLEHLASGEGVQRL